MIQFKRGSTSDWKRYNKKLEDGQPGYDKDKKILKIGDGSSLWEDLPEIGGLSLDDLFCSEAEAKNKQQNRLDPDNGKILITYGDEEPEEDESMRGLIYLQCKDDEDEEEDPLAGIADYIIDNNGNKKANGWNYQIFESGYARCSLRVIVRTTLTNEDFKPFFLSDELIVKDYPILFKSIPVETVTLAPSTEEENGFFNVLCAKVNTKDTTGSYKIIGTKKRTKEKNFVLNFIVEGQVEFA